MVALLERYGKIVIHLNELIEKNQISKNKLSHRAEMQRTQINHYCNNTITRLDTDVLARLCTALNCDISDLLQFIPPEENGDA
ncbi:MAG: helix-turn-helix transcriptional regulator [Clostridia bacterium]|nr:helix-turn-helix transcriptional regulator [Clostridia bacterium]